MVLFLHIYREFFDCSRFHYICPVVLHASWLTTFNNAFAAQIALIGSKWKVVQFAASYLRVNFAHGNRPEEFSHVVFSSACL